MARKFKIDGDTYKFYGSWLGKVEHGYDPFNREIGHYTYLESDRVECKNKYSGMLVLRWAIRLYLEDILNDKPNYFYYSTHDDPSWEKLFDILARKIERMGYTLICKENGTYHFQKFFS